MPVIPGEPSPAAHDNDAQAPSPYADPEGGGRLGWLKRLLLVGAILLGLGLAVTAGLYQYYVVAHPGSHIDRAYVMSRIARESPVYYRDGETKIGVFFSEEHRQYVTFDELPTDYVNAIVASEDKRFWDHPGFDIIGFTRAMLGNLKARRLIGGGSTITSQTAKNLYDRQGRSLGPKLKEVLNAFRLEAHYSKEEILEFYVNQFHVYGNGRGLGVAARYFFDKDVSELGTLECAFLAGVVKGPHRYNPFVGETEEGRARTRARAESRVDYVLTRMAEQGYLSREEAQTFKAMDIPFKQGQFRYEQNVILDYLFTLIREEPFATALADAGIEDPETAGIEIITTIDAGMQDAAEYGLRHSLTELGGRLEGVEPGAFVREASGGLRPLRPGAVAPLRFFDGIVLATSEGEEGIPVDLGGVVGILDGAALKRVADILAKAKAENTWTKGGKAEMAALKEVLTPGVEVTVSIRAAQDAQGRYLLDLETAPELQGAVIILDQGEIRGMVGGSDNRNYNRAIMARRQFGSTFKPLVYAAALSLGWQPLDVVDNRRQGFPFQNQPFYWPRAAHEPPAEFMSMAWSGFSSENVAAVSLLYHLTDPLNEEARIDLARRVDMAPRPQETSRDFGDRMRDEWGILPTEEGLREGLYKEVIGRIWPDLVFEALVPGEGLALRTLPYGRDFPEERARLPKAGLGAKERAAREAYLSRNFQALEVKATRGVEKARAAMKEGGGAEGFYRWEESGRSWLIYSEGSPEPGWTAMSSGAEIRALLRRMPRVLEGGTTTEVDDSAWDDPWKGGQGSAERPDGSPVQKAAPSPGEDRAAPGRRRILGEGLLQNLGIAIPSVLPAPVGALSDRLLIEGVAAPAALERIRAGLDDAYEGAREWERFDLRRLTRDRDFCLLLGMNYVTQLAREAGVQSELKPVLSLPLGSNDTQLLEMALLYQFFLQGRVYTFGEGEAQSPSTIIKEIRNVDGSVIYRATPGWRQLMEPWVATSVGRILRGVVERGTGRRANEAVPLTSPDPSRQAEIDPFGALIPLMGKTGTTNDYVNAAFVGFMPTLPGGEEGALAGFPYGTGLTVATYVGYDDNRPMREGGIRLDGASGSLPGWIDTVTGISRTLDISRRVDLAELAFSGESVLPILWPTEMISQSVNPISGLPEDAEGGADAAFYEVFIDPVTGQTRSRYEPFHPGR